MIVEKQMECRLAGETEVLGRKPAPAPLLSITKSHMTRPGYIKSYLGIGNGDSQHSSFIIA
jgi:hypothetical protein